MHLKPIFKSKFYSIIVGLTIITQIIFFGFIWKSTDSDKNELAGTILFTGDTFGTTVLSGCQRHGSMTRRASTINKFHNALYIDYGNAFKNNSPKNYSSIPRLERCYGHLGMDILNLTKRDFIHLIESGKRVTGLCLVSANLQFDSTSPPAFSVFPYRLLQLRLTSRNTTETITVGITGITNNNRLLHNENINFTVRDAATSLKTIMPPLAKADIKILLYNDWPHKLEPILTTPGIDFDLVIAATTQPQHLNTIIELKETPVLFSDIEGRTLGNITVIKTEAGKYDFQYEPLLLGMGTPEDDEMKVLMKRKRPRRTVPNRSTSNLKTNVNTMGD